MCERRPQLPLIFNLPVASWKISCGCNPIRVNHWFTISLVIDYRKQWRQRNDEIQGPKQRKEWCVCCSPNLINKRNFAGWNLCPGLCPFLSRVFSPWLEICRHIPSSRKYLWKLSFPSRHHLRVDVIIFLLATHTAIFTLRVSLGLE